MGYHRAGFEVVGVDINPQPHYPFEFHRADAMTYPLDGFDVIHASPPCQAYSSATNELTRASHPDLYAPVVARLIASGLPYVIENVIGAPYGHGVILCGITFGLEADGEWIRRHRNFETSWLMWQPDHPHPDKPPLQVTTTGYTSAVGDYGRKAIHHQGPFELACRLMGIDWMTRHELGLAIPPAFTEWIGGQLLQLIAR